MFFFNSPGNYVLLRYEVSQRRTYFFELLEPAHKIVNKYVQSEWTEWLDLEEGSI